MTESGIFFDWSMGISSHLVRGVGSWIQHLDVFVFPSSTRVQQTAFSKISALESDLKRCVFADRFYLTQVDDRPNQREKNLHFQTQTDTCGVDGDLNI